MRVATTLLRRLFLGYHRTAGLPRSTRGFRPQLEGLEDRLVMSTIIVDPTPGMGNYTTIGVAVANANPGDVIDIDTATYTEQVVVSKNLTLQTTPGHSNATIKAPSALSGSLAIVDFTGTGVTSAGLLNLNIQGPSSSLKAGVNVEQGASGVTISGDAISNIQDANNLKFGNQTGIGILIGGNTGGVFTSGTATIQNNTITTYQKGGIVVENTGSNATITGNTVTGAGKTNQIAQNGIEVGFGATASVTNNTISGNIYGKLSVTGFAAADILLYQPGAGTTASNNNCTSCDVAIWALDASSPTISNNSISGFDFEGIDLDIVSTGCSNATVTNNTISNSSGAADGIILFNATGCKIKQNNVSNCGENGIWLAGGDTSNTIGANTVTKCGGDGIVVADFDNTKNNGIGTTSTSSGNSFSGNSASGSGSFDAQDVSKGSGTAGTADTWSGDTFGTKSPNGLK
jgi:parallel beta-helix repeat protein